MEYCWMMERGWTVLVGVKKRQLSEEENIEEDKN